MTTVYYDLLLSATTAGGSSALSAVTELTPAGGEHSSVAPAKFTAARGSDAVYSYETRYVDGEARRTVLIDSPQSQRNRLELALALAIADGHPLLGQIPRIQVTYVRDGIAEVYSDLTTPHRVYDAHIRAGKVGDVPTTNVPAYRAARDATPADARALFDLSPISLVLGAWDATRRTRQGRWPSAISGEIIGVLADQREGSAAAQRGGARVDPVGMQAKLNESDLMSLADAQRDELSIRNYSAIATSAKALKKGETGSAAALGLGGIPPALNQLGGVACSRIIRSGVLSFATLRQVRFGAGARGDAACRAVLAALAINGMVRSNTELYLRANCILVEAGPTDAAVDRRNGHHEQVTLPTIDQADDLLAAALDDARQHAGLDWSGQILEVTGNPAIVAGIEDDTSGND